MPGTSPSPFRAQFLRHATLVGLGMGLLLASLELHSFVAHAAMSRPAPVSIGASHAGLSAHFDGLLSLERTDCPACILRSRGQSLAVAIPAIAGGPQCAGTLPENRRSRATLSVYRLGPSRAPPRV